MGEFHHLKNIIVVIFMCIIATFFLSIFLSFDNSEKLHKYVNDKQHEIKLQDKYNFKKEPIIRVYCSKDKKIIKLPLEEYIKGVICSEMPITFENEALKAQAVAARTYALAHMKDFGGNQYNKRINADVCDGVKSQVYIPKQKRLKIWSKNKRKEYWNKVEYIVNSTKGEFLVYDGDLVKAPYYFATSSGKTENSENVFKESIPYLKSVDSPGEEIAPKFKTVKTIKCSEVIKLVNQKYKNNKLNLKNITREIVIKKKTQSGSVKEIKVGNVTMTGPEFRRILGLNSAKFSINFKNENIIITCLGYGHNVGMSQWGANVMAKKNKKYKDILSHYYTGTKVEKVKY